jgi:hypothetical protein
VTTAPVISPTFRRGFDCECASAELALLQRELA